jgi:glycosyltransferase involved in cell wall biosynthesis
MEATLVGTRWSGGYIAHLKGILCSGGIPPDIEVSVVCSPTAALALGGVDSQAKLLVDERLTPSPWAQARWRRRVLPGLLEEHRADLHFNPSGRLSSHAPGPAPRVTMCQNLLPFDRSEIRRFPPLSLERQRQHFRYHIESKSFEQAQGVSFPSRYALEKVEAMGTRLENTAVVPYGVDDRFRRKPSDGGLPASSTILYISPKYIYKHQWHVAHAVAILRKRTGVDFRLELVGSDQPYGSKRLNRAIAELGNPDWIRNIGATPPDEIPNLLHRADLFVWATTVETFGMTLVEAMASGLPIACSERRPMKDILGDAGVYFDAEDPTSIAGALERLLDDALRNHLARRAYDRSESFSWKKCAEQTFAFFKSVAEAQRAERSQESG